MLSTEDPEAILKDAGIRLSNAEAERGSGSVVNYISWGSPYDNYSEGEIINTGY